MSRLALVMVLGLFLSTTVVVAEEFHSPSYGYSIDIPPGWVEIPNDVLQEKFAGALQPGATIHYDAGFQLASSAGWFEYPYVLVHPVLYPTYGGDGASQINEDQFEGFVKMLTGMDLDEALDDSLTADTRQLLSNLEVGRPRLDAAGRRFFSTLDMDVQGVGPIRVFSVGNFGRDSLLQIHFYALSPDWDSFADVRSAIVDSFRFDPDKAYSIELAAANPGTGSSWQRFLKRLGISAILGVGGLIVAAIAAGFGALNRRRWFRVEAEMEEDDD